MKRIWTALIVAALASGVAAPASADIRSDGSKFLEAVKERDGSAVHELLGQPGNTLVNARELATGRGALHIVAERRDPAWVRYLLQNGANPNIADNRGVTPLQIAAQLGFIEGMEALLEAGASVDVANSTGETPLIAAVHLRNLPMVRLLLDHKASLDRTDNSGRSARDYAKAMNGGGALLEIFAAADKTRSAAGKTYGPD